MHVGSLGQFDALYRLDLKLIDAKKARIAGRIGESVEGSQARLVSAVQVGVHKLLDPIARAAAEVAGRTSPPAEKPAPRPSPPPEKPTPARATAEPVAEPAERSPPSPALPAEPIARPWSVELRLGIARFSGGNVEPNGLRPGGFGELDLVGAYRPSQRWSFYAAFVGHSSSAQEVPLGAGTGWLLLNPTRLSFGAAWNPGGNRYLSVAADLGFVKAKAEARAVTEISTQSKTGPAVGLEARVDYPLGERWFVGARVGVHMAFTGFDLTVKDPVSGQAVKLQNDMGFLAGLAAAGYRF